METTLIETALKSAAPLFDAGVYTAQQAASIVREFFGDSRAATAIANRVRRVRVDEHMKVDVEYA